MEWTLPPQSANGQYKLVATDKINSEIYLVLIGDNIGAVKCSLDTIQDHSCEKLQEYISSLLPEIKTGLYNPSLN